MNNDDRFDELFDILLEQAGQAVADEMGRNYPEPEHKHVFSKRHEANMKKIFRKERNKLLFKNVIKYSQRAAVFTVVITIVSGVTIFSVQAWRMKFLNFVLEINQMDTDINLGDENFTGDSYSNDYVSLGYIPDGFKLKNSIGDEQLFILDFAKDDIYFKFLVSGIGSSSSIDTENANIKRLTINGLEAIYSTNSNVNILVWHDEDHVYNLSGNLEEKELIKIAENVKK